MDTFSPGSRLLTTDEVAAYLHVSRATVYRLVDTRRIPFTRVGGVLRYARPDLDAWLRGQQAGETPSQPL